MPSAVAFRAEMPYRIPCPVSREGYKVVHWKNGENCGAWTRLLGSVWWLLVHERTGQRPRPYHGEVTGLPSQRSNNVGNSNH